MLLPSKFPVGTSVDDSGSGAQAWEFASAFRHAATGMALLAPDGRALRVNPALCELVGRAEAELLSGVVPTHPEDAAADRGERERCLRGEQAGYRRELRLVHRTGAVLWVEKTCTLVRDAAGAPLHFICQVQDIGERKRAEQALRESEARFRSLTLLSSHWYWEQDEEYRFTSFDGNSRHGAWRPDIRTLGLRRWEVPGLRPLWGTWADHRALLEARRPFRDAEFVRVRPGSPPVYVSTSGEPVFDQSGRFTGYRGTTRDITAAKAAETRLRDTEALMRMAARMGRLGAWTYEVGDARVTWSDELCRLHEVEPGYAPTAAEAAGFFTAADRPRFLQAMEDCIRSGVPFDFEAKVTTSKGHERWVRVIGEAERDEQGRVRRVHGAGQDVSASRRAAERARQQAEQLANTLETLTDGFFTVDRDWRFTYLNGEVERLLGRRRDAVLGRRLDDEFPPETAPAFHGHFCQAMAQNTVVQAEAYYAPLALWIHLKIYPSPQGLAVYVRDVTERVRTQQQLLRMNAELESRVSERTARLELANRELEAFSYAIAHDLRAPLSAIEGFGQCLERFAGEGLPERGRHYLQRILAGVRHMRDLTEGLLSLASLSQASLRVRPVDLAVLAQAAAASCRARDPARAVQVAIAPNMPVEGDSRLLALVLENLVGNAWKFTARAAEARIEVGCAGAGEDGRLVYFVRDNGAGFDSAYSAKLFEPFQRLHTQEEFEGTGIGLAIVHKVVSLHGGRIWAESAPGAGATFFFTLG